MPRNIEIKARIPSLAPTTAKAAAIADGPPAEIAQDDTFFNCGNGRLKLRQFSDGRGELIFYRRSAEKGPKESFYVRSPTPEPNTLRELLTLAYGQRGRVVKRRLLFMVGRTRVHLDRVEGLGNFLELEVVLKDGERLDVGVREAEDLMGKLGIEPSQLVEQAYIDLLEGQPAAP